jgi:signal transduction histidine kinase
MFKLKTKFRIVTGIYMLLPLLIMVAILAKTPVFLDHAFQEALIISLSVILFMSLCGPLAMGLKWICLNQAEQISRICTDIRQGNYRFCDLPNEPADKTEENEMITLMRDMNWMVRQIELRETELETRVAQRTKALEQANQDLVKARDEALASARAKSEFLATMSHEIRTPMNAIMGMSEQVLKTGLDSRQHEFLTTIHTAAGALLKIINDILDFSKLDAGRQIVEKIPFHPGKLIKEVAGMFRHQLAGRPVDLIVDLPPEKTGNVSGDPGKLRQVLVNLLSNAIKFTPQGEIRIKMTQENIDDTGVRLHLSVQDTGIGMTPDTLDRLFTPFTQAEDHTTRKYGGTGLGLAISRKLIHIMGGEIRVTSESGKGSCFSFYIAAVPEVICSPAADPAHPPPDRFSSPAGADTGGDLPETPFITPEILAAAQELGRLIRRHNLQAKPAFRALSVELESRALAPILETLDARITAFDFPGAGRAFTRLENSLQALADNGENKPHQ